MLGSVLGGRISRDAAGTFALKAYQSGIRVLISLAVARSLGAAGYGVFSFAMACVGVLGVAALLGFDGLLAREIPSLRVRGEWGLLQALMRLANRRALTASVVLALAGAGIAWILAERFEPGLVTAFWIALLVLPVQTATSIQQAILFGLHRVVAGQIPGLVIQPTLFLALLGFVLILPDGQLNVPVVVWLHCATVAVALLFAAQMSRRARITLIEPATPEIADKTWFRSSIQFGLTTGLNVLSLGLGVIMLGVMAGPEATGIFGIASAAAALVSLPLMAVNAPLTPTISAFFATGDEVGIQRLATKAARSSFLVALPLAIILIGYGEWLLALFGPKFDAGYFALVILTLAQLFNVGVGSVGLLLQMTGRERVVLDALAIAVAFNIATNLALIPMWGPTGAAVGAAGNIIVFNALLLFQVRRRLGVRPTAFNLFRPGTKPDDTDSTEDARTELEAI